MAEAALLRSFNFRVVLTGTGLTPLGDGAFQEVTGLEAEMDVMEYREGGRNDAVIQLAGRVKYPQKIVLKRGMFVVGATASNELWRWFQDTVAGVRPLRRYDGAIEVLPPIGPAGPALATWRFRRGLPARIVGPTLNARTGDVAVEELHIAHEGLYLEGTI